MTFAGAPHAKIAAIVILYLPTEKTLFRLLKSLQGTVEHIYIVDNTPTKQISWVSSLWFACNSFQVRYLSLGDNFGIAKAQNAGIEMAIQSGCDHVILFDQDSEASPGMVATLLAEECSLLSQDVKVGSVGPAFIDEKTGDYASAIKQGWFFVKRIPIHKGDTKPIAVDFLIASGTLIRMQVLQDVGVMMDELFIDWVDIEWSLRAGKSKYVHFMVTKVVMSHSIGDDFINVGNRKFHMHNDTRKYYIVRNACNLSLNSSLPLAWRINTGFKVCVFSLIYFATASKRLNMLKLLIRAFRDGMFARLGKKSLS